MISNLLKTSGQSLIAGVSRAAASDLNNGVATKVLACVNWQQTRSKCGRPDPKWRRERSWKIYKVELPNFEQAREDQGKGVDHMRQKLKEQGLAPPRPWNERPTVVSCSTGIYDEYVPPEGDGKASIITGQGVLQRKDVITKKGRSYQATRTIRRFEGDDWDAPSFANQALDIYKDAHIALMNRDYDKLHNYVSELLYPEFTHLTKDKTLRWKLIDCIDPPLAVHVRTGDVIMQHNTFGQVTVRLHTRQTLAIYDRHGRLIAGDENKIKDVLEYVVFEKHVANEYGMWRLHGKITPKWVPPKEPIHPTFFKPVPPELDKDFVDPDAVKFKSNEELEEEQKKKKEKEQIAST